MTFGLFWDIKHPSHLQPGRKILFEETIVKVHEGDWHEGLFARDEHGDVTFSAYHTSDTNPHTANVHNKADLRALFELAKSRIGGNHPVLKKTVVLPGLHCYHLSVWAFTGFIQLNVQRGHGADDLERFLAGKVDGTVTYMFSPIIPEELDKIIELLAD